MYNQKVENYVLFSRHTENLSPRYSLSDISKELSQRDKAGERIYRWLPWRLIGKVVKVLVIQSCPTLCDPMDCSQSGSSVHGFLQARILEWVAISFYRGSSQPRNQTQVSCIVGRFFTI